MRSVFLAGVVALMVGAFTGCSDSKTTAGLPGPDQPGAAGSTGTGSAGAKTMIGPGRGRIPAPIK
jgi:hypothetical protein